MPDFIYGFSTCIADKFYDVIRPESLTPNCVVYKLRHDDNTTIRLELKNNPRLHRQKAGPIAVPGLNATLVRRFGHLPQFVVTWRNSTQGLLLYVPLSRAERICDFLTAPKPQLFSIITCPAPQQERLSPFHASLFESAQPGAYLC